VFPRDMVCLRNTRVDTLYKGDTDDDNDDDDDDDDNNNNNNNNNLNIHFAEGITHTNTHNTTLYHILRSKHFINKHNLD
jgi:hypothetical protein